MATDHTKGIICGNYAKKRGNCAECTGAWCKDCFKCMGTDMFTVRREMDEEGNEIPGVRDDGDFVQGRGGDHLMAPFQCEPCHFQNIYGRDPVTEEDMKLLVYIRRASLDAFWD